MVKGTNHQTERAVAEAESNLRFRPLGNRVVVEVINPEKMVGNIIIPDSALDRPTRGMVVAVGDGTKNPDGSRVPMDVEVGDEVLFGMFGGSDVEIEGITIKILKEEDVIAVIERDISLINQPHD